MDIAHVGVGDSSSGVAVAVVGYTKGCAAIVIVRVSGGGGAGGIGTGCRGCCSVITIPLDS